MQKCSKLLRISPDLTAFRNMDDVSFSSVAAKEKEHSPMHIQETKLPSITVSLLINDPKTCPKCEHVLKNGFQGNNIHSTLAYSRCRCHRVWKYDKIADCSKFEENSPISTRRVPRIHNRFVRSRCTSAQVVQHQPLHWDQPHNFVKPRIAQKKDLPALKSIEKIVSLCNTENDSSTTSVDTTSPLTSTRNSLISVSTKTIDKDNSSSITRLPQILTNQSSSKISSSKFSPLRVVSTDKKHYSFGAGLTKAKRVKNFEFVHLLKYVPLPVKLTAADLFPHLDQDGDGHLSYTEVFNGLGKTFDSAAREILDKYLRPVYHVLGDATFFGKRDFVLCYCMVKLLQQHRLPKLPFTQSIEFYSNNIKPIMTSMYLSATDEGTIPIFVIEAIVKDHCQQKGSKIVFKKFKVTNLIEKDGLLSLLTAFILAPFLFEVKQD